MAESTTLRLHDRRAFRRALAQLELEHDVLWEARTVDIHSAVVRVALENPDLLLQKVEEVKREGVNS